MSTLPAGHAPNFRHVPPLFGLSCTGCSVSMPFATPLTWRSNQRPTESQISLGSPAAPKSSAVAWSPGESMSRFGPVSFE